jgi:hypothetical protein
MNNQSLIRRAFAVMVAAVLAVAFAVVGGSAPASAAPQAALDIVSVTRATQPELDVLVQGQRFNVTVRVVNLDANGDPTDEVTTVARATRIALKEVSDTPGVLSGETEVVIPRNGSGETFTNLTYSPYASGVELQVSVVSGVDLKSDTVTRTVALTAVGDTSNGEDQPVDLTDPNCGAPTSTKPNCGHLLLPNGANGQVTMYVAACTNLAPPSACEPVGGVTPLVVTAVADIDGLYNQTPATMILACDKALCRGVANGVPKLPVIFTFDNSDTPTGWETAEPCPAKGALGDIEVCVDYVESSRNQGDLYTHILFSRDIRFSHP